MKQPKNQTSKKRRRPARRIIFWAVCFTLLTLFALGPRILAATFRPWVEGRLSEETGFEVTLGGLKAGWFIPASIEDIEVKTKSGDQLAQASRIQTEKNLLGLIFRDEVVGGILFTDLVANIPLQGAMLEEVAAALGSIDIRSGLVGQILNPDSFAVVDLQLENAQVNLRPLKTGEWAPVATQLDALVIIDHSPSSDILDVTIDKTPINLTSELGDFGLQFVAPVLKGALDLEGQCALTVSECNIHLQQWQEMDVAGVLEIQEASADIEAKLIRGIAQVFAEPEQAVEEPLSQGEPPFAGKKPLNLKLAKDNQVSFSVKEGIVRHDGLSFGLPELLPNLQIQSHGDVGFDSTLDFQLDLEIPFDKMGEEGLLAELGSPAISVPVTGTFEEPEIGIGDRQLVRGFVRNAVLSFTDDEVDVQPWLDRLAEKGLLKDRLKHRRDKSDALDSASGEPEPDPENKSENLPDPGKAASGSATQPSLGAPANDGMLDRLRQRRQASREKRDAEKEADVDASYKEGEKARRKFFGRGNEKKSGPR